MNQITTRDRPLLKANLALARRLWTGQIRGEQKRALDALFQMFRLSVAAGDLQLLEGRWYVTHSGLLRLACRKKCVGIKTALQKPISDPVGNRWVFKAIVYTAPASRGFVGYGDADPSNVSPLVRGAEMRVAETRAVNRALRKAYGIPSTKSVVRIRLWRLRFRRSPRSSSARLGESFAVIGQSKREIPAHRRAN
jgi:hypothetical protein